MKNPDDFAGTAANSSKRLGDAAAATGIEHSDPLSPMIQAFQESIEDMGRQRMHALAALRDERKKIGELLREGQKAATAKAAEFRASCKGVEARVIEEMSERITTRTDAELMSRARTQGRLSSLLVTAALVGALCLGVIGDRQFAKRDAEGAISEFNNAIVQAANRNGPKAAKHWTALMEWNDVDAALASCNRPDATSVQGGRRVCQMPLWIEK